MTAKKSKLIKYNVDATGKPAGRFATEIVHLVRGKNLPSFEPNKTANVEINISNIDKLKISDKKLESSLIYSVSGYPGGLMKKTWKELFDKSPKLLFLKVIRNMIPANKLKKEIIQKIKFI